MEINKKTIKIYHNKLYAYSGMSFIDKRKAEKFLMQLKESGKKVKLSERIKMYPDNPLYSEVLYDIYEESLDTLNNMEMI